MTQKNKKATIIQVDKCYRLGLEAEGAQKRTQGSGKSSQRVTPELKCGIYLREERCSG